MSDPLLILASLKEWSLKTLKMGCLSLALKINVSTAICLTPWWKYDRTGGLLNLSNVYSCILWLHSVHYMYLCYRWGERHYSNLQGFLQWIMSIKRCWSQLSGPQSHSIWLTIANRLFDWNVQSQKPFPINQPSKVGLLWSWVQHSTLIDINPLQKQLKILRAPFPSSITQGHIRHWIQSKYTTGNISQV